MDEKRELLMQLLFGKNTEQDTPNQNTKANLEKWVKAQEKAATINKTLEDPERSAAILRKMMRQE